MNAIWRSLLRAGGTRIVRKVGKAMPVVGTAVVISMTAYEIKKKGLVRGIVNTALDATPVIGTAKNVIEVFTGDWLPDKEPPATKATPEKIASNVSAEEPLP